MNQELIVLVEQAAQARGERPLVPRNFIAKALEKIANGDEEVEKYPTGAPSLKGVYVIAVKLFKARGASCGGDGLSKSTILISIASPLRRRPKRY